jgi:hypothetical protein
MSRDQKNRIAWDSQSNQTSSEEAQSNTSSDENDKFQREKVRLVDFLESNKDKRKLTGFLEETYKSLEQEAVDRLLNRIMHEQTTEHHGATPWHKPGHIGPIMYEYLNMMGVESAFVNGLQQTKSSMTETVEQRVDEISHSLKGAGGFNRQFKSSLSRSAVIYLEQDDPNNRAREKVVFTVNVADFELWQPLDEEANREVCEDGRTMRRKVWDEAVNRLSEIVSNSGLKPKYVKNDKNNFIFVMRQYFLSQGDQAPDEYFTFELRHLNTNSKKAMTSEYTEVLNQFQNKIAKLDKKLNSWFLTANQKQLCLQRKNQIEKEQDFYIGTHPDPREMDSGLVFTITLNTLKDYSTTKDKMRGIMTQYLMALSRISEHKKEPVPVKVSPPDFNEKIVMMKSGLPPKKPSKTPLKSK